MQPQDVDKDGSVGRAASFFLRFMRDAHAMEDIASLSSKLDDDRPFYAPLRRSAATRHAGPFLPAAISKITGSWV
jgi:hypothetical protein